MKSRGVTLASYDVKAASNAEGSIEQLNKILKEANTLKNYYDGLKVSIEVAAQKAQNLLNTKQAKLDQIRDLLYNPGEMEEGTYKILQAQLAVAQVDYDLVLKVVHAFDRVQAALKTINPFASIASIVNDIRKWNEIGKIYEHGHPLPSEMADPERKALVQQMLEDCRAARAAYFCDAVNSCLSLVDEISTLVALVATATGAGAPVGWLQKAAVTVGIKGIRAMLMSMRCSFRMFSSKSASSS